MALGLRLGGRAVGVTIEQGDPSHLAALMGALSGAHSIDRVAARTGIRAGDVADIVSQLSRAGMLYDYSAADPPQPLPAAEFAEAARSFFAALRFDMFRHVLFSTMPGNERLFVAAANEYFFCIRDAERHIGLALQSAPPALAPLLRTYLDQERGHAGAIAPALAAALEVELPLLDRLAPLASTDAAMLKTRELASSDTLSYVAVVGLCEAGRPLVRSDVLDAVRRPWSSRSMDLLDVLLRHYELDTAASHADLFSAAVAAMAPCYDRPVAAAALQAAHQYKHYLDNIHHEVMRTYAHSGAPLPRLTPRLADFLST